MHLEVKRAYLRAGPNHAQEYGHYGAMPCYKKTYGYVDQERKQRNGDTTPTERQLLFRVSYLLLYEDEVRSVEGPDANGRTGLSVPWAFVTRCPACAWKPTLPLPCR